MRIGIEHEFVFKDRNGTYLDFDNAEFETFQKIVDAFPYMEDDDAYFECKSLEKKPKRCYVEGFERYDDRGRLTGTVPKGLEIRTLPHSTIEAVIDDFVHSYAQMLEFSSRKGLAPVLTSKNP